MADDASMVRVTLGSGLPAACSLGSGSTCVSFQYVEFGLVGRALMGIGI